MKLLNHFFRESFSILLFTGVVYANESAEDHFPMIEPERFEKEIKTFEFRDKVFPPHLDGVVFVGSSSFTLWNHRLHDDLSPLDVIGRGFGGSTIIDAIYYIDRIVTPYQPRAVVVYEGDNDIGRYGLTPTQVRDGFKRFFEQLQRLKSGARLYVVSIKPSILRQSAWSQQRAANRLLKEMCSTHELMTYIDVATPMFNAEGALNKALFIDDGLHMNEQGYKIWAQVLSNILFKKELKIRLNNHSK
jgi:lysophospholipase L1-like esterase